MPQVRVAAVADIPDGTGKTFTVEGKTIAIFRVGEQFFALDDTCSHDQVSLGEGEVDVDDLCVECPRHGSLFSLETGRPRTLPAYEPVATYKVWVEEEMIVVELW